MIVGAMIPSKGTSQGKMRQWKLAKLPKDQSFDDNEKQLYRLIGLYDKEDGDITIRFTSPLVKAFCCEDVWSVMTESGSIYELEQRELTETELSILQGLINGLQSH